MIDETDLYLWQRLWTICHLPGSRDNLLNAAFSALCCKIVTRWSSNYGAVVWTALYDNYVMCDLIVWQNTNLVHFRAIWEYTTHVQWARCSPKGSHVIHWTSAVFSHIALKWATFAHLIIWIHYFIFFKTHQREQEANVKANADSLKLVTFRVRLFCALLLLFS